MTTRQAHDSDMPSDKAFKRSERATFPASDIGVTLRVSDEALEEFDRIQDERIKAAQEDQKFSWR